MTCEAVNKKTSSHIQHLSLGGITSPSSIVIFTSQYQYDLWNVLCAMYCLLMKSGGQMQIVDCLEFSSARSCQLYESYSHPSPSLCSYWFHLNDNVCSLLYSCCAPVPDEVDCCLMCMVLHAACCVPKQHI